LVGADHCSNTFVAVTVTFAMDGRGATKMVNVFGRARRGRSVVRDQRGEPRREAGGRRVRPGDDAVGADRGVRWRVEQAVSQEGISIESVAVLVTVTVGVEH